MPGPGANNIERHPSREGSNAWGRGFALTFATCKGPHLASTGLWEMTMESGKKGIKPLQDRDRFTTRAVLGRHFTPRGGALADTKVLAHSDLSEQRPTGNTGIQPPRHHDHWVCFGLNIHVNTPFPCFPCEAKTLLPKKAFPRIPGEGWGRESWNAISAVEIQKAPGQSEEVRLPALT